MTTSASSKRLQPEECRERVSRHRNNVGPVSTIAFVTVVWMVITTVAAMLEERGVRLYIHPSHNLPGDTTARERLEEALREYKRRAAAL